MRFNSTCKGLKVKTHTDVLIGSFVGGLMLW